MFTFNGRKIMLALTEAAGTHLSLALRLVVTDSGQARLKLDVAWKTPRAGRDWHFGNSHSANACFQSVDYGCKGEKMSLQPTCDNKCYFSPRSSIVPPWPDPEMPPEPTPKPPLEPMPQPSPPGPPLEPPPKPTPPPVEPTPEPTLPPLSTDRAGD